MTPSYLSIIDIKNELGKSEHFIRKYLSEPSAPQPVDPSVSGRRGISYLKTDIDAWLKLEFNLNLNKVQETLLLARKFNPIPRK
ncbi:hypothetical protein UFOVP1516_42 [uncultured Caudovirales phage]|uniref:Uncharacterized protein n=1 Tax=uncultured Caudovirales phage TaxID=2100421 RepID=A0A6J5PBL7_9CAUD|nr:hypothetical protein UFOVP887_2 [uncultured Caudovirales phage]CAB5226852.1 hypothetical protein UFOVP1516_42 [uncultured Caudovirales phage]